MNELLYGHRSLLIASALLALMLASMSAGFRLGRDREAYSPEPVRTQVNTVLASMLGLLALMLGFSFSLALQRFEDRSQAVVSEANAIGTAYLRAGLLPAGIREEMQAQLREYVDVRIRESGVDLANPSAREALIREGDRISMRLWGLAARAVELDSRPATTGLFLQVLNDMIDAASTRQAALDRHVPEIVLLLLLATILVTSGTLGYSSGVAGHRVAAPVYALTILIVCVAWLIIDLDRPRRGAIQVSHQSLLDLQKSVGAARNDRR